MMDDGGAESSPEAARKAYWRRPALREGLTILIDRGGQGRGERLFF